MPQGNVELIEQLVAVFNERGIEATREFCDPEMEFHEPPEQPGARVARGIDQVVEFFTEFDSAWESHRSEPLEIRAVGEDRVLMETVEHFVGRTAWKSRRPSPAFTRSATARCFAGRASGREAALSRPWALRSDTGRALPGAVR